MKKNIFIVFILVLVLVMSACSNTKSSNGNKEGKESGKADYPEKVTIGYQIIPNAELLAKELKLVEKKFPNTKVKWVQFESGRDVNTAMASGDIDLGLAGTVPVVTGIATNLPYQIYYIHDVIGEAESLVVKKNLKIKSFEDLKGKRLAVPFGSTAHFSLLKALDSNGINQNEVKILDMQPPDILAAWKRGDIDGAYIWHPTLGKIENTDGQVLTTSKALADKGIITADLGIVNKKFAQNYPKFIADYKDILDQAIAKYKENPKEVAQSLTTILGVDETEILNQIKGLIWIDSKEQQSSKYLGTEDKKGDLAKVLEDTGKFLVDQKIITSNPKLSAYQEAIYSGK